nr:4017_t:CDS:2 [Entrophospora candida]
MDVYSVIVNLGQENRRGTNPKTWYDKGLSVDRNEFSFGTVRAEVKELIEIILLDIPKKKETPEMNSINCLAIDYQRRKL